LAIQGRTDPYGTLAQIDEIESRSYAPVETLVLDDCAHAPHLDQPRATLTAVGDFLTRLERIEAAVPDSAQEAVRQDGAG
jgi:pimeloyl-ACP methyl ester carboxylesterase